MKSDTNYIKIISIKSDGSNKTDAPNNPNENDIENLENKEIIENNQHYTYPHNNFVNPKTFKDPHVQNDFELENDVLRSKETNEIDEIMLNEKIITLTSATTVYAIIIPIIIICIILLIVFCCIGIYYLIPIPILLLVATFILGCSFVSIKPNESIVLTYYGKYLGTCKNRGYYWVRPFCKKEILSLKSNHYNGKMIKVNDKKGNPIFIGCVVVWKIRDTYQATYGINNYRSFVPAQAESAVRYVCCKYPYEGKNNDDPCLKNASEEINQLLKLELERRIKIAGIEVEDARITEISYGKEIEKVMLQRQAADVTIAAKEKIAFGAVDIIEKSLKELERKNVCNFNSEEKVKLVSKLMVMLNMEGNENETGNNKGKNDENNNSNKIKK